MQTNICTDNFGRQRNKKSQIKLDKSKKLWYFVLRNFWLLLSKFCFQIPSKNLGFQFSSVSSRPAISWHFLTMEFIYTIQCKCKAFRKGFKFVSACAISHVSFRSNTTIGKFSTLVGESKEVRCKKNKNEADFIETWCTFLAELFPWRNYWFHKIIQAH